MKCTNLVTREDDGWFSAGYTFRRARMVAGTRTRRSGRDAKGIFILYCSGSGAQQGVTGAMETRLVS